MKLLMDDLVAVRQQPHRAAGEVAEVGFRLERDAIQHLLPVVLPVDDAKIEAVEPFEIEGKLAQSSPVADIDLVILIVGIPGFALSCGVKLVAHLAQGRHGPAIGRPVVDAAGFLQATRLRLLPLKTIVTFVVWVKAIVPMPSYFFRSPAWAFRMISSNGMRTSWILISGIS